MRKLMVMILALVMALASFTGCNTGGGGDDEEKIDPNKTQLYVQVYKGGFGVDWMDEIKASFELENPTEQIILIKNKDEYASSILPSLRADSARADMFFSESTKMQELIELGLVADITDVYKAELEVIDGKSKTLEKIVSDDFLPVMSKNNKYYGVPFFDTVTGLIYDHDKFSDNGWLTFSGVDGLPANMSEFQMLINTIKSDSAIPFAWSGFYDFYTHFVLNGIMAQYDGLDNFNLNYNFSGVHSELGEITPQTGYKMWNSSGRLKALEFMRKYMTGSGNYHPCVNISSSHTDAQNNFLLGGMQGTKEVAMLVDGNWWEREAKGTISKIGTYGATDYRFLPFPAMEGQKGADGKGNGNVYFSFSANSAVYIKKSTTKLDLAKRFLAYTCKQENLKRFTKASGGIRPFDYTLNDTELKSLTKFAQNVYGLYRDPNVKIARPLSVSPLINMTADIDMWKSNSYALPVKPFLDNNSLTAEAYFNDCKALYTAPKWEIIYNKVADYFV